jgi:hypothetical protein
MYLSDINTFRLRLDINEKVKESPRIITTISFGKVLSILLKIVSTKTLETKLSINS